MIPAPVGCKEKLTVSAIFILAGFGIVLIGLEVFLPGGIIGLIGICCSVASVVLCFTTESVTEVGAWLSFVLAACVVGVTTVVLVIWLKHFQNTGLGKRFVLDSAIGEKKDAKHELKGEVGEAANDLGPLGKVRIGNKRHDARSESGLIPAGTQVQVIGSNGMELVVRAVESDGEGNGSEGA